MRSAKHSSAALNEVSEECDDVLTLGSQARFVLMRWMRFILTLTLEVGIFCALGLCIGALMAERFDVVLGLLAAAAVAFTLLFAIPQPYQLDTDVPGINAWRCGSCGIVMSENGWSCGGCESTRFLTKGASTTLWCMSALLTGLWVFHTMFSFWFAFGKRR